MASGEWRVTSGEFMRSYFREWRMENGESCAMVSIASVALNRRQNIESHNIRFSPIGAKCP
jgi:hypothetical protein